MARQDRIEVEGVVLETLPGGVFRVALPNGHTLVARRAGRVRLGFRRLVPADRVRVEMSPYDLSRGTIIAESKQTRA